jgi:hypothetical protein
MGGFPLRQVGGKRMTKQGYSTRIASIVSLLFVFLVVPVAFAANNTLELRPHWKQGDKKSYEIVKTQKKIGSGDVLVNATNRTDLQIAVIKADSQGYLVSWTMGETKFEKTDLAENPIAKQVSNLLKGFSVILRIDPTGVLKGVENWEELKDKASEALNAMSQIWSKSGLDAKLVTQMKEQLASTFATKEKINQMCTREANLYFMALGRTYKIDKAMTYDTLLPNPFGGEAFPATGSFVLKSYDKKSGKATIDWKQHLLPKETSRVMKQTMERILKRLGKNMKHGMLPDNYKIEDRGEFIVAAPSGWVLSLTRSRTVMTDSGSQEDSTTIKVK